MSTDEKQGEIWSQLDKLPAQKIMGIVEAAVIVLQAGFEGAKNLNNIPPNPLINILQEILYEKDVTIDNAQTQMLITENITSLALSRELLRGIACFPELAREVENVYHARQNMMAAEPVSWLLAGALLVLAIKVQEIDMRRGRIRFTELSDNAVRALCELLRIGKGE